MNLKINPIFAIGILIVIGVLAIALIRGCRNEREASTIIINSDSLINKLKQDSVDLAHKLVLNTDTMRFMEGQLSLSKNKEIALNENLHKADARITNLLNKHIPIKPNPLDTGIITVPMQYVNECADCFTELDNGVQLVRKYKAEKDNQEQIYKGQLNIKDNRINHLEKANKEVMSSYMALINITKDIGKPKRMLYFSYGVLWSAYVPRMGGIGLMYQDKRLRQFGVKGYFGYYKPMIETQANMPLSFKRK